MNTYTFRALGPNTKVTVEAQTIEEARTAGRNALGGNVGGAGGLKLISVTVKQDKNRVGSPVDPAVLPDTRRLAGRTERAEAEAE